jgi:hypothetical protein
MWNDLKSKGVVPKKTYMDSSEVFNYISEKLIHHFIRGYFDGDGGLCESKNGQSCIQIIGTNNFLIKLRDIIVENTGMSPSKLIKRKNTQIVSNLGWSGIYQIKTFYDYVYKESNIYLERKKPQFEELFKKMIKN